MTLQDAAILERLLRDNGLGWMIDSFAPSNQALAAALDLLSRVSHHYQQRTGTALLFTPDFLVAEAEQNPHQVRAFLQALGTTNSAEMLVMVWRILQGLGIQGVSMNYSERESFQLQVVLARPGSSKPDEEVYASNDINDAALLRHFGIATIDSQPLFDGFYPLRTM